MIMKVVIFLAAIIATTVAQRSPYAGSSPIGRPGLASRFKDTEESTTVSFDNRIGSDGSTVKIPTDARGDVNLVNRLNQWPRDNQPFWLINAEHIERQRHPDEPVNNFGSGQQGAQTQNRFVETQGRFGGAQDGFGDNFNYGQNGHNHFGTNEPNFGSRSNFESFDQVPSRTIRPVVNRSGFLGPI